VAAALYPGQGSTFGLSDIHSRPSLAGRAQGPDLGVGAIAQLPTHTDDALGNDRWARPTAVVLKLEKAVLGIWRTVNNIWSVSGSSSSPPINQMLVQPFLNYNFAGRHLPHDLAHHHGELAGGQRRQPGPCAGRWRGPHLPPGKLPLNTQIGAYYNVVTPDDGPTGRCGSRSSSCSRK